MNRNKEPADILTQFGLKTQSKGIMWTGITKKKEKRLQTIVSTVPMENTILQMQQKSEEYK